LAFVWPQDLQKIHGQMSVFMNEHDINLPQLPEFDLSRLEAEWTRLLSNIPEFGKFSKDGREFQVGEAMKARGLTAQYPVVIIPGIVSTVRWLYWIKPPATLALT
jgi:phospholipid:diacylglycerol acyltransferase